MSRCALRICFMLNKTKIIQKSFFDNEINNESEK